MRLIIEVRSGTGHVHLEAEVKPERYRGEPTDEEIWDAMQVLMHRAFLGTTGREHTESTKK